MKAFAALLALLVSSQLFAVEAAEPKYAPTTLTLHESHEFFRRAEAPDFWALIPYYAAQRDGSACSLATVTMLVNAARTSRTLSADDELATQDAVIERTNHKAWRQGWFGRPATIGGVTLDQLGEIVPLALAAYGVKTLSVEVVHADQTPEMRAKLHSQLIDNEKSARDFILLNFDQKAYTGDAEVGHIAPLGAYDEKHRRALVLDPDRKWYEPYWVSEETLLAGMATRDPTALKNRGWVYVKLAP